MRFHAPATAREYSVFTAGLSESVVAETGCRILGTLPRRTQIV